MVEKPPQPAIFNLPPSTIVGRDQNYRVVFANQSRIRLNPTEVSLTFSYMDEAPPGQTLLTEQVTITLTPEHTKALMLSLVEILKLFEKEYGHIFIDLAPKQLDMKAFHVAVMNAINSANEQK
jgi:hypothetical protein